MKKTRWAHQIKANNQTVMKNGTLPFPNGLTNTTREHTEKIYDEPFEGIINLYCKSEIKV